jgi:hypothetical protein
MKKRTTVALDVDLVSKERLAVREGAAPTLASVFERGLRQVVKAIERERKRPFKVCPITLPAGRKQRMTER